MWQYPVLRLSPLKDANLPRLSLFKKSDLKKRGNFKPQSHSPYAHFSGANLPPADGLLRLGPGARGAGRLPPHLPHPRPGPSHPLGTPRERRAPGPRAAGRGRRRLITNATCRPRAESMPTRCTWPRMRRGHTPPGRSRPGLQAAFRARASHPSRHKAPCGAGPAREGAGRRPSSFTAEDSRPRRDQPTSDS